MFHQRYIIKIMTIFPLCFPEILDLIVKHCDVTTHISFALTCVDICGVVFSRFYQRIHSHLQQFIPIEDVDAFWALLDASKAVIEGSLVTNMSFVGCKHDHISNLNIMLPKGELDSWMTLLLQINYSILDQPAVPFVYLTTTRTVTFMLNTSMVNNFIFTKNTKEPKYIKGKNYYVDRKHRSNSPATFLYNSNNHYNEFLHIDHSLFTIP